MESFDIGSLEYSKEANFIQFCALHEKFAGLKPAAHVLAVDFVTAQRLSYRKVASSSE